MKTIKYSLLAAGVLALGGLSQSCSTEEPFGNAGDGELRMKMVINSDVTRAETDEDALRSNCVVYISGQNGLLYKWKGLENVPESLMLKGGQYVAEAWTGDSVSASFDKKFYRGYEPFTIRQGVNSVVVNCKIANVVVSVNPETIDPSLMKDWNINVANSRASLDFTAENMDYAKGYFMMPNADKELVYTITGTNTEGRSFTHTGKIENPERAHEYVLNVSYHPEYEETGGAFVTISVNDEEILVEDEIPLYSRPAIKGVGYDADKQIAGNAGQFSDQLIKVTAFGGISSLHLATEENDVFTTLNHDTDLMNMTDVVAKEIEAAGIKWDYKYNTERNLATSYITLTKELLNSLPERDQEYALTITATDKYGKSNTQTVRFAVGEGAIVIEDPVVLIGDPNNDNLLDVRTTYVTLSAEIADGTATNPGIRIREAGTPTWITGLAGERTVQKAASRHLTPAQARRAKGIAFTVKFSNLKPGTRYEYQAIADGFESESKYFTTEGHFTLPFADMEQWTVFKDDKNYNIDLPGVNAERYFWDNGNHGSMTMGVTLTKSSNELFHSGNTSAKLRSQFVGLGIIGKFAAGNLFVGTYKETNGTNGVIDFGQPYDGSHPDALKVWANYRPGNELKGSGKAGDVVVLNKGDKDHAQIYIAFTIGAVTVNTGDSKTLFDPNGANVLGYGEVTWKDNFGPDGSMQQVTIPITWKDKSKTVRPTHMIIVCSASKYGDYFTGCEGSTLYVDDFELAY
ncbi:MAG: PCMD domain-containing protein [Clostridium sp.]|nr:PCMD domain-containing protein [Prevotella sp.]MCM1428297.1 PCMD domain-containing protein [Clostridium sp.]MCM1474769.1 PCMD domain-containing protein [Muribaculaceae bacterium]